MGAVHKAQQMFLVTDKAAADEVTGQSRLAGGKLDP